MAAALLAGGCAHEHGQMAKDESAAPPFRLGQEDVIEVSVYKDPELTRVVPVRPDGRVSLPIVGEIVAAGRTPDEVRQEILQKLKPWVQDPTVVSVIVHEVNSARYFVLGEVEKPGAYPMRGEVTVLQALATAGGPGEFSARDVLTVVRGATGQHWTLDLDDLESGKVRMTLHPGDTLVVR